jgi:hypothetical protein
MKSTIQLGMVAMIAASFLLCSIVIIADAGIWNTPYETTDDAGHKMGFNDRLYPAHYKIIFSNFEIHTLLTPGYFYSWLLLAMHAYGAWLVLQPGTKVLSDTRRFFLLQGLIFPVGWIGAFVLPSIIQSFYRGTMDREGIIDVPFVALTAHPIWVTTAMLIALMTRFISTHTPRPIEIVPRSA